MSKNLARVMRSDCHVSTMVNAKGVITTTNFPGKISAGGDTVSMGLSKEEKQELAKIESRHEERVRRKKRSTFKELSAQERQNIIDHNKTLKNAEKINDIEVEKSKRFEELSSKDMWGHDMDKRKYLPSIIYEFPTDELEKMHSEAVLEEIIDGKS